MWYNIKTLFDIYFLKKEYLLNLNNGKIHYYTCEWCDNIKEYRRINLDEVRLYLRRGCRIANCCKDRINSL